MTTDQPRLAKSRLLVADAFTKHRAAAVPPDPHDAATWFLDELQALGWTPPRDLTDTPPPRPERSDLDGDGYRQFQEARAQLATRTRRVDAASRSR